MRRKTLGGLAALAAVIVVAAGLLGCGNGGIRGFGPNDTDYFMTAGITDGSPGAIATDIRCSDFLGGGILSWDVNVDFLAVGGAGPLENPTPLTTFALSHYTVTYRNISVPGGPVPTPFTLQLPFDGLVPLEHQLTLWPAMGAQQKSSWPLNDPAVNLPGGSVTYVATVTTFGAPVTAPGDLISASFDIQLLVVDTCANPDPVLGCPRPLLDPFNPSSFCD